MAQHGDVTAHPEVLNSWKEVAAYLDKDVRTVMRWEQNRGLPVHRLPGGPKAGVFALKSELDAWRQRGAEPAGDGAEDRAGPPDLSPFPAASARSPLFRPATLLAAGLLLAAAVAGFSWLLGRHRDSPALLPMTRLTYDRDATWPTLSGDGRLLAYASNREGKFDIYVQQISGRQSVKVTRNEADNWQPSLSPDGAFIAFRSDRDGGGVYVVESIGGVEREVARGGAYPRFSPDGRTILYLVRDAFTRTAQMFMVPVGGGPPRAFHPEVRVPPVGTMYSVPMWSADGKFILFEGSQGGGRGLWVAPVDGGRAVQVPGVPPMPLGSVRIYSALVGGFLYYVEGTSVHGAPLKRLPLAANPWRVSGPPEQLTSPSLVAGIAAVSATGRAVLAVAGSYANTIWSLPLGPNQAQVTGPATQETPDAYNQLRMSVASHGSRFAYLGNPERGRLEILLVEAKSRRMTVVPLADDSRIPAFHLSPDGSRLAYRDTVDGRTSSYLVPVANPADSRPVCENCVVAGFFSTSPDLLLSEGPRLSRFDPLKISRTVLLEGAAADPVVSPDDRWLAFVGPGQSGAAALFVAPVRDGQAPREEWILVDEDANFIGSPQWSPDGALLYYLSDRDSFSCVWARRFDAVRRSLGPPVHVYHDPGTPSIKTSTTRSIGVTPGRLYVMMASAASNIWMMELNRREGTASRRGQTR